MQFESMQDLERFISIIPEKAKEVYNLLVAYSFEVKKNEINSFGLRMFLVGEEINKNGLLSASVSSRVLMNFIVIRHLILPFSIDNMFSPNVSLGYILAGIYLSFHIEKLEK